MMAHDCIENIGSEVFSVFSRRIFILFCVGLMFSVQTIGQEYDIISLPVNSPVKNDFAPYVKDSVLYFASNRKNEILKSYLDQNNEGLYRLYGAKQLKNNEFGNGFLIYPEELGKLNTSGICYANGDSLVFLTQNMYSTYKRSKGRDNKLGIFIVNNENGNWGRPSSFSYNSRRDYSNGQVTVSDDGNTMFYVSDQPGGYGETDIYQSEYVNGEWTEPKNLGSEVNTSGKELFPFYHPSGRLYFSSDRSESIGELDIFYTTWDGKKWVSPIRLDSTINTPYNDFSCFIFPDDTEGYFASDRGGNDDIYHYKALFPVFDNAMPQVEDNYCFTLYDDGPYQSDTMTCVYKWSFGDGESEVGLEVNHCYSGPGHYSIKLNMVDTLINKDLLTVAEYNLDIERTVQVYITAPDTVSVGTPVSFSAENSVLNDFEPENFYWYFGDGNKAIGETNKHIFRTKGIYTIVCGVVSLDKKRKMGSTKTIVVTE